MSASRIFEAEWAQVYRQGDYLHAWYEDLEGRRPRLSAGDYRREHDEWWAQFSAYLDRKQELNAQQLQLYLERDAPEWLLRNMAFIEALGKDPELAAGLCEAFGHG